MINGLTVVAPLRLRGAPAHERGEGVVQGTAVAVAALGEGQAVWRLFAVSLTQQGVQAVVQAGAEAQAGGVARGHVVVLPGRGVETLVVVPGRAGVFLLEGGEQSHVVLVRRRAAVQTSCSAVAGHL